MTTRRRKGMVGLAGVVTPALVALGAAGVTAPAHAQTTVAAPGGVTCEPAPQAGAAVAVVVGQVACQELTSNLLGNGVAAPFEYYVPPVCDPTSGVRCPVLYLLHGFGGDYTEMLDGPGTTSSAWIQAEQKQPPAGFESHPWDYADPGHVAGGSFHTRNHPGGAAGTDPARR